MLDEAGTLLAKVNPELPQPLPPAVPLFVVELFKTDVELHARCTASRGEDLEEQKRIVRSHFDKEPRTEKLPGRWRRRSGCGSRARIKRMAAGDGERPAPTLLLPGMARHLHEQRGVPLDPAKEVARLHQQLRGAPDDALVLAKLGAGLRVNSASRAKPRRTLPLPSNGWSALGRRRRQHVPTGRAVFERAEHGRRQRAARTEAS